MNLKVILELKRNQYNSKNIKELLIIVSEGNLLVFNIDKKRIFKVRV